MKSYNVRVVSSYPPEVCGIGTHTQDMITALGYVPEVDSIRVAAIDRSNRSNVYHFPVDLVINQPDSNSWSENAANIISTSLKKDSPTVIYLQHEYGLSGQRADGNDYQKVARLFKEGGDNSVTVLGMHTVLEKPSEHQLRVVQELSDIVDGITVPAKTALEILSNEPYNLDPNKMRHIDHGIRVHDLSGIDSNEIKARYGLDDKLVVLTLGLKSPNKGIEFGISGFGQMINDHFSSDSGDRKKLVYLIAGQYHPGFVNGDPEGYGAYTEKVRESLERYGLKSVSFDSAEEFDRESIDASDVVFLEQHLSESLLRDLYLSSDIVLLPYKNREQISSGILADAVGSGRPIVSTKFTHARELLSVNGGSVEKGIYGLNPQSRGVLVDLTGKNSSTPSIKQIAQGLEYLVFDPEARSQIAQNTRKRGYEMRWEDVAEDLGNYFGFLIEKKFSPVQSPVQIESDT